MNKKIVVAERRFEIVPKDGNENVNRVTIRFFIPSENQENEWVCPFEIEAPGYKKTKEIYGVDSFQALSLSIEVGKASIEALKNQYQFSFKEENLWI
ncbi:MAG: DUF6968 family protein [Thermonemataceae bacterium]